MQTNKVLIASASRKGSGESVHMHRLTTALLLASLCIARAIAAHEDEVSGQNVDL